MILLQVLGNIPFIGGKLKKQKFAGF